jgi:hypothetical protein
MPALDKVHEAVRNALIKDGWTITHNPLTLKPGGTNLFVDLGAEKLLAAEKGTRKIAVEIKTFGRASLVAELQQAIGQFGMYEDVLAQMEPERVLYLAVPQTALDSIFQDELGKLMLKNRLPRVIGVSTDDEEIVRWIP